MLVKVGTKACSISISLQNFLFGADLGTNNSTLLQQPFPLKHIPQVALTRPDSRTRWDISFRTRVHIEQNARVSWAVCAREGNQWAGLPVPTSADVDLTTSDVELRPPDVVRSVQGDMLDADQVFSIRQRRWKRHTRLADTWKER